MAKGPYGSIGPFGPLAGSYNPDGSWTPSAGSILTKLRDAGELYPNPEFWTEVEKGPDDFILTRGNTGLRLASRHLP